jgi:hypothetical protein
MRRTRMIAIGTSSGNAEIIVATPSAARALSKV